MNETKTIKLEDYKYLYRFENDGSLYIQGLDVDSILFHKQHKKIVTTFIINYEQKKKNKKKNI
jgi:hypothetical protein